jgi:hypothetical protein
MRLPYNGLRATRQDLTTADILTISAVDSGCSMLLDMLFDLG